MTELPRITIVVPSFNQGRFIRETLQSLVDQQYPNLEVIIQDAGSTDGAAEIAREFADRSPDVFRLYIERDRGHANAVNMAFKKSTGEILGYLNTDDTLYPGCLDRVAREIDPARGRCIVFGRCLFTGEGSPYVGQEHPAEFHGHFDMLAVWRRGYSIIPQPATFWHRTVHDACGEFDERHNHGLDYLQWCRFSKRFTFHKVDELWSTYRMHPASVSSNKTEAEWLDIMIRYSRMHWGPWWQPLRWRCTLSYWWHDRQLHERARHHARRAERARAERRYGAMLVESVKAMALSPRMAWHRFVVPVARLGRGKALDRPMSPGRNGSEPVGRYSDGWIGPVYRVDLPVPDAARRLVIVLEHAPPPEGAHRRVSPRLYVDGVLADRRVVREACQFSLVGDLTAARGRPCRVEVLTPEYFVPRFLYGTADDRKLSALLLVQRIE
jgi:glycosyltransferase involved in cell wall biosynthesis